MTEMVVAEVWTCSCCLQARVLLRTVEGSRGVILPVDYTVALMEEACDTFTTFLPNTHHPALREMFTFLAGTMECYARMIRAKMADEGGDTSRPA